jgi:hypothetical protein
MHADSVFIAVISQSSMAIARSMTGFRYSEHIKDTRLLPLELNTHLSGSDSSC